MTTLENSYCVPKTEEEWEAMTELHGLQILSDVTFEQFKVYIVQNRYLGLAFINGKADFFRGSRDVAQEVPVQHFIDLVEDRINAQWRLNEAGFKFDAIGYGSLYLTDGSYIQITSDLEVFIYAYRAQTRTKAFLTTFTDLLALIKFLTPPTK